MSIKMSETYAQKLANDAKARYDEAKQIDKTLNDIYGKILKKMEDYDCKWDITFNSVSVIVNEPIPKSTLKHEDLTTWMNQPYYSMFSKLFENKGFEIIRISYGNDCIEEIGLKVMKPKTGNISMCGTAIMH